MLIRISALGLIGGMLISCAPAQNGGPNPPNNSEHPEIKQLISICGFGGGSSLAQADPNALYAAPSFALAETQCETPEPVYCPIEPGNARNSYFCETKEAFSPGYWWRCAPDNMDLCDANSCVNVLQPIKPAINWDENCAAFKNAVLAYENPQTIDSELKGSDPFVGATSAGNVQYFYYRTKDRQWVSFRGTNNACNAIADVLAVKTEEQDLGMTFHGGFLKPAKEAFNTLRTQLLAHKHLPIHISGHSLGGAAAAVFGILVASTDELKVGAVTTFGQPEVTTTEGVTVFNERYAHKIPMLRIINRYDVVPYSVSNIWGDSAHFGPELRIGWPSQQLTGMISQGDFSYFIGSAGYRRPDLYDSFAMVNDHVGSGYGPNMENQLQCPHFQFKEVKGQQVRKPLNIHLAQPL